MPRFAQTIARTETVLAALRQLGERPEVQRFHDCDDRLDTNLIQLFVVDASRGDDNRALALPLARLLGGVWRTDGDDCWRCDAPTFPGLERVRIILHYVEPVKGPSPIIDLSEPTLVRESIDRVTADSANPL